MLIKIKVAMPCGQAHASHNTL